MRARLGLLVLGLLAACGHAPVAGPPPFGLDEQAAAKTFPTLAKEAGKEAYDPVAGVVLKPGDKSRFVWPEHPDGYLTFVTNERGFREDAPTPVQKTLPRIFVTGDSHTEGAVDNDESFASRLEQLSRAGGAPGWDVINAGVGGTGPHNYLGMTRLHADLQPDLVIVGLYSGNDFQNVLAMDAALADRPLVRDRDYSDTIKAATARWPDYIPQGFNQAFLFKRMPQMVAEALDSSVAVLSTLADECAARGSRVLVLLLPSKLDVEDDDAAVIDAVLAALKIDREDFAANMRLARQVGERLAARGVPVVDATDALRTAASRTDKPLYWRHDHHLSTTGHFVVARLLAQEIARLKLMPEATGR
jgi:hypothetical protein